MPAELNRLVSELSRAEIEKLLAAKDEVEALQTRRRELEKEIAGIDKQIAKLVGRSTAGRARGGKTARRTGTRRKAGAKASLEDVVVQVLTERGEPMAFKEILETITSQKLFRSRSKSFDNVLRRTISTSDKIKRVSRGVYGL
ncbi:hypothetical protein GF314_11175 [bacterium]|nr:hypothetical protein [bacterium]